MSRPKPPRPLSLQERKRMQESARDLAMRDLVRRELATRGGSPVIPENPRPSSLRTFFDARFRARWWVLLPLCWGLLLAAAAATWYVVR